MPHGPSARVACLHAWLRVLGAPAVAEERDLALALVGLGEPVVRDAVVLTCTPDGRAAAEELVLTGGTGAGDALDALFDVAGDGPVPTPDRDQLAAASRALALLARYAQGPRRADPLAVMAWAAWWEGDGAQGLDLSELALRSRRDHSLALLVHQALRAATPPGWVRAPAAGRAAVGAAAGGAAATERPGARVRLGCCARPSREVRRPATTSCRWSRRLPTLDAGHERQREAPARWPATLLRGGVPRVMTRPVGVVDGQARARQVGPTSWRHPAMHRRCRR